MKISSLFVTLATLLATALLPACSEDGSDYTATSTTIYSILYDSVYDRYGNHIVYSDYRMTVDATSGTNDTVLVYNSDSLPYQSDVSKVRLTISTSANAYLEVGHDQYRIISTTDTFDCRKPLVIRSVGNDAEGNILQKVYKLEFRIHQVDMDSVAWQEITGVPGFEGRLKTAFFGGRIYVFSETGTIHSAPVAQPDAWREENTVEGFDYASPTVFAGRIYLTAQGKVYSSTDGSTWEEANALNQDGTVETLLGATSQYMAGIKDGYYCSTQGSGWRKGTKVSTFERTGVNACVYPLTTNPHIQQIAILGRNTTDTEGRHNLLVAEEELLNWGEWGPVDSLNYLLPFQEGNVMIRYKDNQFYCFGGYGETAFENYYTSGGLYWEKHKNYTFFPETFQGRKEFAAAVDQENYIWIVFSNCTSQPATLFRGRLNSYNF